MLNIVLRVNILVLFLMLEKILSVFHHREWCLLCICPVYPLLCLAKFPPNPLAGEILSLMSFEFCQKLFLHLLSVFLVFNLLIWCITLIHLHILKNTCILKIKSTWLWCMIFFKCCWILFATFFLKIFASILISDNSLFFFVVYLSDFWSHGGIGVVEWSC